MKTTRIESKTSFPHSAGKDVFLTVCKSDRTRTTSVAPNQSPTLERIDTPLTIAPTMAVSPIIVNDKARQNKPKNRRPPAIVFIMTSSFLHSFDFSVVGSNEEGWRFFFPGKNLNEVIDGVHSPVLKRLVHHLLDEDAGDRFWRSETSFRDVSLELLDVTKRLF